ncbi:MAG: efflux RND transporter periplasmic adaptor subunit [Treponema sp.]|jgi:multidrug efflux pump subunit AcrA (membrane-fusion protein)|nr:efflux RND transporter periplasmic adaptor subunit [Treponema sp.]
MPVNKGDLVAKIIVIALIAAFLGLSAYTMLKPKAAPAGGMPGAPGAAAQSGTTAGGPARQGSGEAQGGQRQGASAANAITVSAKTLVPETIRQVVKLNGDVSSQSEINIYPDTAGKIVRVLKDLGDSVRQGEIIAYIDPSRPGAAYVESPVIATVGGTVISMPVALGETVSASTSMAVIGSLNNLKITIYVAEKYSSFLRRDLPALVSFASAPGEEFEAAVSAVSPVVNNKNRTIETTLNLRSRDSRIKQGMFASVQLVIREEAGVMVIPRSAIKNYNGESTVYVIDQGAAKRLPVTVGLTNDAEAQIISPLKPGDQVIIAGAVTDGSPVRIARSALQEIGD